MLLFVAMQRVARVRRAGLSATAEQLVERWVSYFERELLREGSSTNDFWRQKTTVTGLEI